MGQLLDYSWTRPPIGLLGGYVGAARYLSYSTSGKNLTPAEASALTAAGKTIVSNWEWYADPTKDPVWRQLGPYRTGLKHAAASRAQHKQCGGPVDAPVYASADYNTPDYAPHLPDGPANAAAKLGPLADYYRAWVDTCGVARVGGYGGYYTIRRLFDAGLITYGWQTRAWSGGQWDSRAHLRQIGSVVLGGARVDVNDIIHPSYGGWQVATTHGGGSVAGPMDAWKDVVVGSAPPADMGGPPDGIRLGDWVGWVTAKLAAIVAAAEGAQAASNAAAATAGRVEQLLSKPAPPPVVPVPVPVPGPAGWTWATDNGDRLALTVERPA